MSRYPLRAALLSSLPLLGLTLATADEMHHHGKHVHGEVTVNLALEGVMLIAEIEATGAQVLGFERAPRDTAERAAMAAAEVWFRSGREMIGVPTAAGCRLTASDFTPPKIGSGHVDFRGRYTFTCAVPAALAWAEPWALRRMQGVEKIEVNIVAPGVQRQETLRETAGRIALR
jgi:hypothetical protein